MILAYCIVLAITTVIYVGYVGFSKLEIIVSIIGFVIASIIPAMIFAVASAIVNNHGLGWIEIDLVFYFPFSTAFTILLGLPTFLLLRPFRPGHCGPWRSWYLASVHWLRLHCSGLLRLLSFS